MVKLGAAILLLATLAGNAQAEVSARVAKNVFALDEAIELILVVTGEVLSDPDLSVLEQNFLVLDHSAATNTRTEGGALIHRREWNVQLLARREGRWRVPAIRIGKESTAPIPLTITAAREADDQPMEASISFELEAGEAYVQQQVTMTTRLVVAGTILPTSYTPPRTPDGVVQLLGESRRAHEIRDGVEYEVLENRYALFPLKAGLLRIAPPVFKGKVSLRQGPALPFGGNLPVAGTRSVYAVAREQTLQVLPAPVAGAWLPASGVTLSERVHPAQSPHTIGAPLTRDIELSVSGQRISQLPRIEPAFPAGVDVYPDIVIDQTRSAEHGVSARRLFRWTLVPRQPGLLELPALRVEWWDTTAQRLRIATVEARMVEVVPAAAPTAGTAPAAPQPVAVMASTPEEGWRWIAAIVSIGWLITLAAWHGERQRRATRARKPDAAQARLRDARATLDRHLRSGEAQAARDAVLRWARLRFDAPQLARLDEVATTAGSPELRAQLESLDRSLYGRGAPWDAGALAAAIDGLPHGPRAAAAVALPTLYPGQNDPVTADPRWTRRRLSGVVAAAILTAVVASTVLIAPGPLAPDAAPGAAQRYRALLQTQEERVLRFLRAFETLQESIHPQNVETQQKALVTEFDVLFAVLAQELDGAAPPPQLAMLAQRWREALGTLEEAYVRLRDAEAEGFVADFLESRRRFCEGVAQLHALRAELPTLAHYWRLPGEAPRVVPSASKDETAIATGVLRFASGPLHGPYALFVPDDYDPARRWPMVVALHGADGDELSALATWLRPATSRGYLVLAPKALGGNWALEDQAREQHGVLAALDAVRRRFSIDPGRVFVAGLADGASLAYALGMENPGVFAGVAAVAGLLPPALNLAAAPELPILVVHGARDFIVPVQQARSAVAALTTAGHTRLRYEELPDWGHAFPYSIHDRLVLPWMEALADEPRSSTDEARKPAPI